MCICTYICIYTHIRLYIYIYIYMNKYMYGTHAHENSGTPRSKTWQKIHFKISSAKTYKL